MRCKKEPQEVRILKVPQQLPGVSGGMPTGGQIWDENHLKRVPKRHGRYPRTLESESLGRDPSARESTSQG